MEQILTDQINKKLNKSQYTKLSTIMGSGTALNKNKERQNANEQIFLNNLIKEITGKNLLTFVYKLNKINDPNAKIWQMVCGCGCGIFRLKYLPSLNCIELN